MKLNCNKIKNLSLFAVMTACSFSHGATLSNKWDGEYTDGSNIAP